MSRLTLILIVAVASPVYAQSARLVKAPAPVPASVTGYIRGHCVALAHSIRVCKLVSEDKDVFLIEKAGKPLGSLPGNAFLGETSDFEVLTADLDGDRRRELIVANHDTTSNGLGVEYWTIHIFPDAEFRNFQPPLKFSIQEYGSFGTFVASGTNINILTTTWVGGSDPKGKRAPGTYLVGQWWRYQSGKLVPVSNRPAIARRYLYRFQNERALNKDPAHIPFRWLSDRTSETVNTDFITGVPKSAKAGVIQGIFTDAETGNLRITFKPDDGPATTYLYGVDYEKSSLQRIGNTKTGRVYPDLYQPARPESWLTGKRASLRSYSDYAEMLVLWLD